MPHKLTSKMATNTVSATDSLASIDDDISYLYLPNHDRLSDRVIGRGLNYFIQGYVHNIKIYVEQTVKVHARCWRSMRKSESPHSIHIEIFGKKITESHCSCKVGLTGHCSHILGLIKSLQGFKLHHFKCVPDQQSCTSIPQQWHVPRGDKVVPVPINHVIVAKPCESRKRKPVLCQLNSKDKLPKVTTTDIQALQKAVNTPLEYVLSPQMPMINTKLGEVQLGGFLSYQTRNLLSVASPVTTVTEGCGDLTVNNKAPVMLADNFDALKEHFKEASPEKLEISTRLQSESSQWFQARKHRLTSSNFGEVLNRKSAPNDKMLCRLFNAKNISAPSLSYGKRNEPKAKGKYLAQFPDRHIHECGFIVNNEFPFLGATPDGKLCHNSEMGIIEIKCPYSARDMSVSDACIHIADFYLRNNDGIISLKRNHPYYAQIQGQLMITGCSFCEFIVYCPNESDLFVERILPDIDYMKKMLNVLASFFEMHALPFINKN